MPQNRFLQVASAVEAGDDLYKQLDQKQQEVRAVLSARDSSSFAVREQLQLRESQLKSRDAEVQALQQKLSGQGAMMVALEGGRWALPDDRALISQVVYLADPPTGCKPGPGPGS
jgi:hypothetical protein